MYRTIAASFWTDPKVKKLIPAGKLLLLYLITNPHTHVSGIYVLDLAVAAKESGIPKNTLSRTLDTLSELGFCAFDPSVEVIWVRKMMSYQGKGEKNMRSAAAHIAEDLHNSFLCKDFLDLYPEVRQFVKPSFIDTLSDKVSETRTPDSRSRFLIPEQKTEQETERLAHGEHGHALLTPDEFLKLKQKLNSHAEDFIRQFDEWVHEAPSAKHNGVRRKDRNPYASICKWYDRAVKEGRVKSPGAKVSAEDIRRRHGI